MNFSGQNLPQDLLPEFSELNTQTTSTYNTSSVNPGQNNIYTSSADSHKANPQSKFTNSVQNWNESNSLYYDKQNVQSLNLPTYSQNNVNITNNQQGSMALQNISGTYDLDGSQKKKLKGQNCNIADSHTFQTQSLVMAEYIQKLQTSALPLTLQQLIRIQNEQARKERLEEEQKSNNILNIPNVPPQKDSILSLNPTDVNVHIDDSVDSNSMPESSKDRSDGKTKERKFKFKAKTGEIKVTMGLDGSTLYCCPECSLVFANKRDIDDHLQIHVQERKFQCKECGAMLKRKEHLDQHMRGHSDERPFKCPVCQKGFKRNEHLTRHYVIHSGDKNFTCTVCQKAFSRKDHLTKHAQTHLGITKSKVKKEAIIVDTKSNNSEKVSYSTISRQEINSFLNGSNSFAQDSVMHRMHTLQDSNLIQTALKEQILNNTDLVQQVGNVSGILPQNGRYLMPY